MSKPSSTDPLGVPPAAVRRPLRGDRGRLLDAIAAALPDAVLIVDAQLRVVTANAAAARVAGIDPVGQPLAMAIRAPAVREAVEAALGSGVPVRTDYARRVGGGRKYEVLVAPLPPAPGAASAGEPAALLLLRDLTAEQQLERMRVDFVANASHELRTPLASLTGFIETLQGAARDDPAARTRFLDLMHEQARRMRRLIDDLLSLSRIEMNVHRPPSATADLAHVARQAAELLQPQAREAGVALAVTVSGDATVRGDRDELVQVMQNLIENAIKYGAAGGRVEVAVGRDPGDPRAVVASVRDWGAGIAEQHIPRLTERFYRVSVQDSRSRGGTGLGLAIVKHILLRHHGRLEIESAVGRGSVFTVRIGAAEAPAGAENPQP